MAETTTKTATTPRRRTTAAKPATAKAAPRKAAPAKAAPKEDPAEATADSTSDEFYVVELEFLEDTKGYAKFGVPESLKGTMVGALYVPHGTDTVKVKITSVSDPE